jgi:hypothetical protein
MYQGPSQHDPFKFVKSKFIKFPNKKKVKSNFWDIVKTFSEYRYRPPVPEPGTTGTGWYIKISF